MILLLTESRDPTADEVEAWLRRLGAHHLRVDSEDPVVHADLTLNLEGEALRLELASGRTLDLNEVRATWHRRGALRFALPEDSPPEAEAQLEAQWAAIEDLAQATLARRPSLGATRVVGKLRQLQAARAAGLAVPETLVSSRREALERFVQAHPGAVTKSLAGPPRLLRAGRWQVGGATEALDPRGLTARCFPTLAQARVPKELELRVVSLDGEHFAMAQLPAQPDPVDMRQADPRCVPYDLPPSARAKLSALLAALGLDFGVSDLILTPEGQLVFLEVNPEGQLERLSKECGYGLERRVAEALVARSAPPARSALVARSVRV